MAVTHTSYFGNAIVGQPMVGSDYNVYELHTSPRYAVGTGFQRSDGNCYRYVHYGLAVSKGQVVATDVSESSITGTNCISNPTSAGTVDWEKINQGAVGSHYVQTTLTLSNNQVAGGYLIIQGGTGEGHAYRIRGNTSWAGTTCRIELWDKIKVALDQTSDPTIIGSPYANLEPATTTPDYMVVGVAVTNATKDNYGWICTRGITPVFTMANVTGSVPLVLGGLGGAAITMERSGTGTGIHWQAPFGKALDTVAVARSFAPAQVWFE